jgi:hypothetical protein
MPSREGKSIHRGEGRSEAGKKAAQHKNSQERSEAARRAAESQSREEKSKAGRIGGQHSRGGRG